MHSFNPSTGKQRQVDLCEFKARLDYRVSPRPGGATERPCLKKTKTKTNKQTNKNHRCQGTGDNHEGLALTGASQAPIREHLSIPSHLGQPMELRQNSIKALSRGTLEHFGTGQDGTGREEEIAGTKQTACKSMWVKALRKELATKVA